MESLVYVKVEPCRRPLLLSRCRHDCVFRGFARSSPAARSLPLRSLQLDHRSSNLIQAHQLFEASGDKRNALYAQLAAIRAGVEPIPLPARSFKLTQELATNPILQSDLELRMYCLAVKGEIDGEIDNAAMRRDWTEVSKLAHDLDNAKWQYRALGQLGFADFYDGNLAGAQKKVAEALIGATTIKDVGGQIFFLSTTATGLVLQGMNDQALEYADRAIALANATPDAGYPVIAEENRLMAMINLLSFE